MIEVKQDEFLISVKTCFKRFCRSIKTTFYFLILLIDKNVQFAFKLLKKICLNFET